MRPHTMGRLSLFSWQEDTAMYRECSAYVRTLAPVAGVSGGDRWLHPTVFCGMQLLVRAWDVCFWCQSPQMLTLIFMILIFTILDAKWIDLFRGSHSAPVGWPAARRPERRCAHFCSGWCTVGCLAGALWYGWDWSITITVEQICPNCCVVLMMLRFVLCYTCMYTFSCYICVIWLYYEMHICLDPSGQ